MRAYAICILNQNPKQETLQRPAALTMVALYRSGVEQELYVGKSSLMQRAHTKAQPVRPKS